jgi:AcrR family transcriptional regulator
MTVSIPAPPARGTRPRDRKALILVAASQLFAESGFHNVSVAEIAEAVGIGPGALYRHFPSKRDLLARTIVDRFEHADAVLTSAPIPDLDALAGRLAGIVAARRELGVLWSRESRHLDDEHRALIRSHFRQTLTMLAAEIGALRPGVSPTEAELLALGTLGALTSVGYHRTAVTPARLESLLHGIAGTALATRLPQPRAVAPAAPPPPTASRREELLVAAARLASTRGFQSISMEDIGSAVGVTSASVYRYFPSKADLLASLVTRSTQSLHAGVGPATAAADDAESTLDALLAHHVRFAMGQHELLGVLVSEIDNLPGSVGESMRREQQAYVAEWFRLLGAARAELDRVGVRFRVHAALTLVNETVRTRHIRERGETAAGVTAMARAVLLDS